MMKKLELFIPWMIVLIATVGSLFFSEVRNAEPCTLCWYQRIIIFPLAIILGIAAFRRAYRIVFYVLPLSLIGLAISTYQVIAFYFFPGEGGCSECTLNSATSAIGFPLIAFLGFLLLNISLIWIAIKYHNSKKL